MKSSYIMRMIKRMILVGFWTLMAINGRAQNILNSRPSIPSGEHTVGEILAYIEDEEEIIFSYPSDLVPTEKRVEISNRNQSLSAILDQILGPDYRYLERGSYIIIQSAHKNRETRKDVRITGRLMDERTGGVVSNATIYEVNSLRSTQTDSNGNYELKVSGRSDYLELAVSKENYVDTILRLFNNDSFYQELQLKPTRDFDLYDATATDDLIIVRRLVGEKVLINMNNVNLAERRFAQVSFLPFLGTNGRLSGKVANHVSFNVLAGYANALKGVEIGGICNIERRQVVGLQIAGMANVAGGYLTGVQYAGFANHVHYRVKGLQVSGFSNTAVREVWGAQISGTLNFGGEVVGLQATGLINFATELTGLQVGGIMNVADEGHTAIQAGGLINAAMNFSGIQVGGLLNVSAEKFKGIQYAGLLNYCGEMKGVQISSLFNATWKTMEGVQLSGGLNMCGTLKGVQLGIVNVCDTVESGVNIGLFSFVRHGMHTLQYHYSELMPLNVSFKTGTDRFYNVLSSGLRKDSLFMLGYGVGSQHRYSNGLLTGSDIQFSWVQKAGYAEKSVNVLGQFTPFIGFKLWRHANISMGPVLNVLYQKSLDGQTELDDLQLLKAPFYTGNGSRDQLQMSVGYRLAFFF
ncbi:MAG: hypothetical protein KDC76_03995 [Bacteroidetes bacterium]|nr:hypothetical protein [Bacteroidota bacterium]